MSFVPVIHPAEETASQTGQPGPSPRRRVALSISGVAILLAVTLMGYRLSRPSASGIVAVAPASWLWGGPAQFEGLEEGLSERISIELANEHAARVVGWPLMLRFRTSRQEFRQMAAGVFFESVATELATIKYRKSHIPQSGVDSRMGNALGRLSQQLELGWRTDGQP